VDDGISLRWIQNYPDETSQDMLTGVYWALSFMGAELPMDQEHEIIKWLSPTHFTLNYKNAGFRPEAIAVLENLNRILQSSEEHRLMKGVDVGRFIMLTINSSNHYFKIVGLPPTLDNYLDNYEFSESKALVIKSTIALGNRIINTPSGFASDEISFFCEEGVENHLEGNFTSKEFEVLYFMPNGQIRFGLYDNDGRLKSAANESLTAAGKPGKCMWCHESSVLPVFQNNALVETDLSQVEFLGIVDRANDSISKLRMNTNRMINYENTQDHTLMELIYISFMEPSVQRLSNEWEIPESEVIQRLTGKATHQHVEFTMLGEVYFRNEIDNLSPYESIQVPTSAREPSLYEPDLL